MKDIIMGEAILTLRVKAGDIYPIKYNKISAVDIVNYTDGSIFVSETPNFDFENNVGKFLLITDGNCYNEFIFYKSGQNTIYVKADADGHICIIRKQW